MYMSRVLKGISTGRLNLWTRAVTATSPNHCLDGKQKAILHQQTSQYNLTYSTDCENTDKRVYWNGPEIIYDHDPNSVYCMQFDVSDVEPQDIHFFTDNLQSDVDSLKPEIVYVQQTDKHMFLKDIGLKLKKLGYDGYYQEMGKERGQATFFRSNLMYGGNNNVASQFG